MPGQRAVESASYVTARSEYRTNLAAVDTDVTSPAIPVIDTAVNLQSLGAASLYGKGQLNLAVLLAGSAGSATLELWLKAPLELTAPGLSIPVAVNPVPATGEWVFVSTLTASKSQLWMIQNIPPGQYKVIVPALGAGVKVTIREQHAH